MNESAPQRQTAASHLAFGWWLVVVSVALGTLLEGLHALKLGYYLDASNETRRLLFTLAHAHGALLGLVHIAFAASLPKLRRLSEGGCRLASRALMAGSLLLPAGFLLGGIFAYEGDPGLAVLLAPLGALLVFIAVLVIALGSRLPQSS
jgi:hypothetical protein